MPTLTLSNDQRAQLVGWINHEKDFLLSIDSIARRLVTPRVTGTIELIRRDLEFVCRLRDLMRSTEGSNLISIATDDLDYLHEIAFDNRYPDREEFWTSIARAIEDSRS